MGKKMRQIPDCRGDETMTEIYICDSCNYLFEINGNTDRCPDCGKRNIRQANELEQEEYRKLRMEFGYTQNAN